VTERDMTPNEQAVALATLRYVADLITVSPKKTYTREELLVLLNLIENDRDLFDPAVVARMDEIESEIQRLGCTDAGK